LHVLFGFFFPSSDSLGVGREPVFTKLCVNLFGGYVR